MGTPCGSAVDRGVVAVAETLDGSVVRCVAAGTLARGGTLIGTRGEGGGDATGVSAIPVLLTVLDAFWICAANARHSAKCVASLQ